MEANGIRKFNKVLVANRGEIAIRIFRACSELGIGTVAVFSKEDKYAMFRTKADEAYLLDPDRGPVDAYLDIATIIKIAKEHQVDAIHPGYGFLSENAEFADECEKSGITFIGPTGDMMRAMGDKITSKQMAIEADVPVIPGIDHAVKGYGEVEEAAEFVGYPIMLKASNGGGGRGMRIVNDEKELERAYREARDESRKAFGDEQIFVEKYLASPKHIEVQVLADKYGNVVHLYDRDCSVQRRHQKVVEYAPAFTVPEKTREKIFESAIKLVKHTNYCNAGTLEFLVDASGEPYFIEMNPRIQVEHTVTEIVTGIDIVQSQILIAEGYKLASDAIGIPSQESVQVNGYSIQTRITTEDPVNNFLPDTGRINVYRSPAGNGLRLDGGNAYLGAEITPYYDSLLVKLCSHDRTFMGAVRRSLRALKEIRIRGVKTNVQFLINVLNHETFQKGACYTTFIEETPELYQLQASQDRATKIIEFIGERIVNPQNGEKPELDPIRLPDIDPNIKITGSRDEFLKLGAEGFAQKIKNDKRLYITDTTMRDAQQSLFATRMRTKDITGAAPLANQALRTAFSAECWGGATYDTAYRFLKESPWRRLWALRAAMPNTLLQMLLRASNAVGYSNYPDNVVQEFIRVSADRGIDVFRIFDALNWVENMKMPVEVALSTGKMVEGTICYTGDISNPNETKYTLDYYIKKAKQIESLGVHILTIKDMAGLLKPYAAKTLITELKKEINLPINLHTHDTTGSGVATVLAAVDAGVDIADMAIESMSSLTSQPSMNTVQCALAGTERDPGLNLSELHELSEYYARVRQVYKPFESGINAPNSEIYKYEIPGGQYSNLFAQVKDMGEFDRFDDIKKLYRQANDLLGNIVKVTPTSKVVGDLAIFMFKNGLTAENLLTVGKDLSYPASVVEYFKGLIGQPDGGFPAEFQKIVLKGEKPIDCRAGSLLEPVDYKQIEAYLKSKYDLTGFTPLEIRQKAVSFAMYPRVYEDYCIHLEEYNDVSQLESAVYFYGLKPREETVVNIGEGKTLLIKYISKSAPDAEGKCTLTFEVNGSVREILVTDKQEVVHTNTRPKAVKSDARQIGSPIPGTVCNIFVKEGDKVDVNTPLLVVEAMKIETTIVSKVAGVVEKLYVTEGDKVNSEELLATFKL